MPVVIDADKVASVLTPKLMREALRSGFISCIETPTRHHHAIPRSGEDDATLLLMPAWHAFRADGGQANRPFIGVKTVAVFPGNVSRAMPSVQASYLLMAGDTGTPLAIVDGRSLTMWRTAAASALAASFLANPEASTMVMVGGGTLAPYLIEAHVANRPIKRVGVWSWQVQEAEDLVARLHHKMAGQGVQLVVVHDLGAAVSEADIISTATLSSNPLVQGKWLREGAHLDLVGGFTPKMREADDDAVRVCTLFADTKAGVFKEAGDITQPLSNGIIRDGDVKADLFDLCRGMHHGRTSAKERTLFQIGRHSA